MKISTTITINGTAAAIWAILMDFEQYATWNPFIQSIQGHPYIGEGLQIQIGNTRFAPIVQSRQPNVDFSWLGKLWFRGLFDGHHRFEIKQINEHYCEFTQSETFSGLLLPLFKKHLNTKTHLGFVLMNKALKQRVEATVL